MHRPPSQKGTFGTFELVALHDVRLDEQRKHCDSSRLREWPDAHAHERQALDVASAVVGRVLYAHVLARPRLIAVHKAVTRFDLLAGQPTARRVFCSWVHMAPPLFCAGRPSCERVGTHIMRFS